MATLKQSIQSLIIVSAILNLALVEPVSTQTTKVNSPGVKTWCSFCEYATKDVAAQLSFTESTTKNFGEAMVQTCARLTGTARNQCEQMFMRIGTLGSDSFAEEGKLLKSSCSKLPACKGFIFSNAAMPQNFAFSFLCRSCKGLVKTLLKRQAGIVTADRIKTFLTSFCAAVTLFGSSEKCVKAMTSRFEKISGAVAVRLTPDTVCFVFGTCIFAPPEPLPKPNVAREPADMAQKRSMPVT